MSDDVWDWAEPVVMLAEMKTCNGTTVAGGAVVHVRSCPVHGDTAESLRAEVAALTAERDRLREQVALWKFREDVARVAAEEARAERDRLAEADGDVSGQLTAARRSIEGLRTSMLAAEAERDRLREEREETRRLVGDLVSLLDESEAASFDPKEADR
jgi:chromosome segregation ATPase